MFSHILLAANDLGHATPAARMAGETARRMKSPSLCIVVTYPAASDVLGSAEAEALTAARRAKAEVLAAELLREVGSIPGKIETEVLEGSVAEAARAAAQVHGSDLILMASRGPAWLERLRTWFQGERIGYRPDCPVVTVP